MSQQPLSARLKWTYGDRRGDCTIEQPSTGHLCRRRHAMERSKRIIIARTPVHIVSLLILMGLTALPGQLCHAQQPAEPGTCYATTGHQGNNPGSLLTIDRATGSGTLIGPTGLASAPALAIKTNGEMYCTDADGTGNLYRIDAATGATTVAVNMGLAFTDALAFDPNDVLYAVESVGSRLYTVDPGTGAATFIGNTFRPGHGIVPIHSLAFDPTTGVMWGGEGTRGDGIYTIDPGTAETALVGMTGIGGSTPAIEFDGDGNLYGSKGGGQNLNDLISIDKATGIGTVIGPIGFQAVSGMGVRHEGTTAVASQEPVPAIASGLLRIVNPNPFVRSQAIRYGMADPGQVDLVVTDVNGRIVRRLVQAHSQAGDYAVVWDGLDDQGGRTVPGAYFLRLRQGGSTASSKLVLTR
jgi:hypothetical protein